MIKKRRNWKKNVDGEAAKEKIYGKEVGYANSISGVSDVHHFNIHGMKNVDYIMTLITTYGILERSGNETKRSVNGETVRFKYPYIVWNHSTY